MWRAVGAPVVWSLAALLLLGRHVVGLVARALDAYNDVAEAAGNAVLRGGRWLLDLLGPVGRALRFVLAPVWRRMVVVWRWLNVQLLLRMFRPLRRFGRWAVARVQSVAAQLVVQLRRLAAALDPLGRQVARLVSAVERAAGRLAEGWRTVWEPVVSRAARWR